VILRKSKYNEGDQNVNSEREESWDSVSNLVLSQKEEENETLPQYDHRGMEIDLQAHELDLLDGLRGNRREASMEALKLKQMHLTTLRKLMQG